MSVCSTVSISLILIKENNQRAIVFTIELLRGQALSPEFTNPEFINGLVYEHTIVEPMGVHKLDEKNIC